MARTGFRCFLNVASLLALLAASPALAWNGHGHRTITRLALDGLQPDTPPWLRDPAVVARIAEQSTEPDHWRGTRRPSINHDANTEHYLDVEDLDQFGLSLKTLPRLRYEYVKAMVTAKLQHPERILPYDAAKDPDRAQEWPGFLPYAVEEHFDKLRASFNTLRVLEAINDPQRQAALQQARENVIYEMGILSHLVGDAAQPLHTTRHHHGWVGPNPNAYTTDNGFHAYIDGKILDIHGFTYETLKGPLTAGQRVDPANPFAAATDEIQRSFDRVEPLYTLQRDRKLESEAGREFIRACLIDAAATLSAMYNAAWTASKPSDTEIATFIKYEPARAAPIPAAAPTR
jgi:hypothetical protein